jgi:hypothetical protein
VQTKIIFLSLLFFQTFSIRAQCLFGYSQLDTGYQTGIWLGDYLLGVKVQVTDQGVLNSLNLINGGSPNNIKMVLYDDKNDSPNKLVTIAGPCPNLVGTNTFSTAPITINPGFYWLMAIHSGTVFGSTPFYFDPYKLSITQYYKHVNFDSIPSSANDFIRDTSGAASYYFLDIHCPVTINEFEDPKAHPIYPNPATDFIYCPTFDLKKEFLGIFNTTGAEVKADFANNYTIRIFELPPGLYLLKTCRGSRTFIKY